MYAEITICGGKDFFLESIILFMNMLQNATVEDQFTVHIK